MNFHWYKRLKCKTFRDFASRFSSNAFLSKCVEKTSRFLYKNPKSVEKTSRFFYKNPKIALLEKREAKSRNVLHGSLLYYALPFKKVSSIWYFLKTKIKNICHQIEICKFEICLGPALKKLLHNFEASHNSYFTNYIFYSPTKSLLSNPKWPQM